MDDFTPGSSPGRRSASFSNSVSCSASSSRHEATSTEITCWNLSGLNSRPVQSMRSEEHTSELQSLMRISYAVFCLKKKIYIKLSTQQYRYYTSITSTQQYTPHYQHTHYTTR